MYKLYYSPGTASMAVHLTLLELGVAHSLARVHFDTNAQRSPEYLRLNPRGQVPTLLIDDTLFWGADAIDMAIDYLRGDPLFTSEQMHRAGNLPEGRARPRRSPS